MSDPDPLPAPDRMLDLLDQGDIEKTVACLDRLSTGDADTRKRSLRALRNVAEERSTAFEGLAAPLSAFLTDYVRARCAEALGYVAVEAPDAVTDPETLADLRLGLKFDESEVKEKLAKALAYVALGDPNRLRHQVSSLAVYLDDDNELVRYHLCTALVVVGCEHSEKLSAAESALRECLFDENLYVRGRAAEALALFVDSNQEVESISVLDDIGAEDDDAPSFLTDRVRFLQERFNDTQSESALAGVGTIESVRERTDDVVEEMMSADDGECPHCGLELSESGPPMCPRCGAPR